MCFMCLRTHREISPYKVQFGMEEGQINEFKSLKHQKKVGIDNEQSGVLSKTTKSDIGIKSGKHLKIVEEEFILTPKSREVIELFGQNQVSEIEFIKHLKKQGEVINVYLSEINSTFEDENEIILIDQSEGLYFLHEEIKDLIDFNGTLKGELNCSVRQNNQESLMVDYRNESIHQIEEVNKLEANQFTPQNDLDLNDNAENHSSDENDNQIKNQLDNSTYLIDKVAEDIIITNGVTLALDLIGLDKVSEFSLICKLSRHGEMLESFISRVNSRFDDENYLELILKDNDVYYINKEIFE